MAHEVFGLLGPALGFEGFQRGSEAILAGHPPRALEMPRIAIEDEKPLFEKRFLPAAWTETVHSD